MTSILSASGTLRMTPARVLTLAIGAPVILALGYEVHVNCPDISSNCGLAATLDVPRLAGLTPSSGGGNLTVPGIAPTVSLTSDGGDVSVSGIAGAATVLTGGGNLTAGDMGGSLKFTTDGGDVNGNGLTAPTLSTDSGGGDVDLVFTKVPSNLNVLSDGGNVNIIVPRSTASYRVSTTTDSGDHSVRVPQSASSGDQITVNSGGGGITISEEDS
jgi:hypothetical protein